MGKRFTDIKGITKGRDEILLVGGAKELKFLGFKVSPSRPTEDQLAKINRFTRRAFKAEELYIGQLRLANNAIDRDNERFSEEVLQRFLATTLRRTMLLDHDKPLRSGGDLPPRLIRETEGELMITFIKTLGVPEVRDGYLNLTDDTKKTYGHLFPSHKTKIVVIDHNGRKSFTQKHHDNQSWGTLNHWYADTRAKAGDTAIIYFDSAERMDDHPVLHFAERR